MSSQQTTYTVVPNIDDTFDYASYTFLFNNKVYIGRTTLGPLTAFFSQVQEDGQVNNDFTLAPKHGHIKFAFFATQIGSKLFMVGREDDTVTTRGNLIILNSDLSVFRDTVFFDYLAMEMNICRYDKTRNKVIALFSYIPHKDSLYTRYWGIMEFDTLGNLLRKKEITPIAKYDYANNLLVTSDGNYLVSGKLNKATTYMDPFFVKLDTNFNEIWRADLTSTGEKFYSQYISETLLELPNNKGYVYLGSMHRPIDTFTRNCRYFDKFSTLSFISNSGQVTKNYYHNIDNKNCEGSRPAGLFLKNDSVLMFFTQRDTSPSHTRRADSSSSVVVHYNFNQHRVVKEIIGGQLINGKTSWILPGFTGGALRKHVGRDVDGGFITCGDANINDDNGVSAYLMKTDSCGYTQDHVCKLVYKVGARNGKTVQFHVIDSLSVLCQPIWTIEGQKYKSLDVSHTFSTYGKHTIKLWGFAGSTVDSLEFEITIDSTGSSVQVIEKNQIEIYPNPATSQIAIKGYKGGFKDSFYLFDVLGRKQGLKLLSVQGTVLKFDVSDLLSGIYILHVGNQQIKVKIE